MPYQMSERQLRADTYKFALEKCLRARFPTDQALRAWYRRPHKDLDGLTPAEFLAGDWDPDGPQASALWHTVKKYL